MKQHPPPTDFGPDERDVWTAAQKQLRAQGTWTGRSDGPLLEAYVRNVVAGRAARREGNLKVAAESERDSHRYATALLLTPESRKRHNVKAAGNDAEDELQALIG